MLMKLERWTLQGMTLMLLLLRLDLLFRQGHPLHRLVLRLETGCLLVVDEYQLENCCCAQQQLEVRSRRRIVHW
jgi:hypothetical protein